ncbi:hypothetical protein C2845_PM05G09560 [Panicum miliaceum]|uniref:Uncharacterized protein n=1 Tax=Panicum miliaceum TaxID=4540 RepID=A0A3L6T1C4_PANMI|nr:hypothetical protein C2845_PM05G09560 [Panicum miliaceum]
MSCSSQIGPRWTWAWRTSYSRSLGRTRRNTSCSTTGRGPYLASHFRNKPLEPENVMAAAEACFDQAAFPKILWTHQNSLMTTTSTCSAEGAIRAV